MVGIVGILLLGSLAWSAVGALVSAVGSAASALSSSNAPPAATLAPPRAVTPTVVTAVTEAGSTPTVATSAVTPTVAPTAAPTPQLGATPTLAAAGRNPWILLPQPEPGARVNPGPVTIEARGRGDAPITALRLELDGSPLSVSLEQRGESTWRGFATARVAAGQHTVRASVTDAEGRAGSFRWSFSASP
jgi:hypothetical protein